MQKRPRPKAAAAKPKAETTSTQRKPAASRSKNARLLQAVAAQQAAHELLDQLSAARDSQQLSKNVDAKAVQQIKRLTKLLDQLRTTPQTNQQLRRTLTQQQFAEYQELLQQPSSSADILLQDEMPDVLHEYQRRITAADKINALANGAWTRGKRSGNASAARMHRDQAEKLYEQACEYLNEQLNVADAETEMRIRAWLDRDFDYSAGGNIGIDCAGVARIRGSRSEHCIVKSKYRKSERKTYHHECQLDAVATALKQLIYVPAPEVHTVVGLSSSKLQTLLQIDDDAELF